MSRLDKKQVNKTPENQAKRPPHGRNPFADRSWAPVAGITFAVLVGLYLLVYWRATWNDKPFSAHTIHWRWLYLPDDLAHEWVGNDGARFGIADRAPVLAMAGLILALAWLAGRPLLSLFKIEAELTSIERALFAIGLGMNAWSLWTLAVGLLGRVREPIWFWAPAIALAMLNAAQFYWRFRSRGEWPASDAPPEPVPDEWLTPRWLWCAAPLAAILMLGAMLPPWEFDVREYHLQVPKEWFEQGRIDYMPHNAYGNMPLGAEMHALLAMSLWPGDKLDWWWGALVGKTVIGAYSLLTAAALFAAGRRFFSVTVGVSAALLYLSTPWIAHVSMAGLIDGAVGFYFFLAAYAMAMSGRTNALGWSLCAGFLAGASVACKYPALVMVVAPLGIAAFARRKRTDSGRFAPEFRFRAAACFALAAAIACGPWFAKNYALTGNPVYPLAHSVFGGKNVERADDWKKAHAVPRDKHGRSYSIEQLGQAIAQVGWVSDWINPAVVPLSLAALVTAIVGWRTRWSTLSPSQLGIIDGFCGLFLSVFLTWWLLTHRIDRFWLPGLPALALVGGVGVTCNTNAVHRWCALGLLFFGVMGGTLVAASRAVSDNRFLVALDDLRVDAPNLHDLDYNRTHPAHRYLNELPVVGRVLLVGDARPFDLEAPALYATCFDTCPFETLMKDRDRAERLAALRKLNVTHVFVYWREIDRYRETYGFTDYVTRELVRDELVGRQRILRKIPLKVIGPDGEQMLPAESAELFEVAYDPMLR